MPYTHYRFPQIQQGFNIDNLEQIHLFLLNYLRLNQLTSCGAKTDHHISAILVYLDEVRGIPSIEKLRKQVTTYLTDKGVVAADTVGAQESARAPLAPHM